MRRVRYAACIKHRAEAQRTVGITEAQWAGLALGSKKGTNHLEGTKRSKETKRKMSESAKRWCADNPGLVSARAINNRGENHYLWNGGSSKLNTSIRQTTENRRWMEAVKGRDVTCVNCGSTENLESHHVEALAELIERLGVTSREDARKHAGELWNLDNGIALCQRCHYDEHGREYAD